MGEKFRDRAGAVERFREVSSLINAEGLRDRSKVGTTSGDFDSLESS